MTDLNNVMIIGSIVKDTVLEMTPKSNVPMAKFSVAVNRDVKINNEYTKRTVFIDLAIFNTQAEKLYSYLKQGTLVAIEGYLDQDIWTKDEVKKTKLVVKVKRLQLLSSPRGKNEQKQESEFKAPTEVSNEVFTVDSENGEIDNYYNELF